MRYTDDQMIAALREVADGRALSQIRYRTERRAGQPTQRAISYRFGSWLAACAAAEVPITRIGHRTPQYPRTALLSAVVACGEQLGHRPTPEEYRAWAIAEAERPSLTVICDRIGWAKALIAAGF